MAMQFQKFRMLLVVLATFMVGGTISASSAFAGTMPAALLPPTAIFSVSNSRVSASDVASKRVTILSYVQANGLSKQQKQRATKRRWIGAGTNVPGYWNSGKSANGGLFWFWDTRYVEIELVDGRWRKVLCGNFIRFSRPPNHIVVGHVLMVRSFAGLTVHIHLVAIAVATGSCGSASGSASLTQSIKLQVFIKTQGNSTARIYAKLLDRASTRAQAQVQCSSTVLVSTPPPVAPPPPPSVAITTRTILNDIAVGKNSGPMPFTVQASGSGSVKIDPGITMVSDCAGGPVQAQISFTLAAGENDLCIILYAPTDTSATQSSVTYTATVGSAMSQKEDPFGISHPTRASSK